MAFVPGFEHDIFVSYARVDDDPITDCEQGWVSQLVEILQKRLAAMFGRKDAYSLWMDPELAKYADLSPQILEVLEKTATLLVVYSQGYLSSPWCQRERQEFMTLVRQRKEEGAGVFLLEITEMDLAARPQEFDGLLGYRFWEEFDGVPQPLGHPVPTKTDRTYYSKVEDLARDIHQALSRMKGQPQRSRVHDAANEPMTRGPRDDVVTTTEENPREGVFLAEVTDDLEFFRDEVVRYILQAGYRVFPNSIYPREAGEFQACVEAELGHSTVFAQLLGPFAGKKPPGCEDTYVDLQFNAAQAAGKPIVQWRDQGLNVDQVRDPGQRKLLEGGHVLVGDIELFKSEIVKTVKDEVKKRQAANQPQSTSSNAFVFVDTQQEDLPVAKELCGMLDTTGCGYALPVLQGSPEEVREDLEANLVDCDGLIVVYGSITAQWVREQLRQLRKILYRRQKPLTALAVCEGPPDDKSPLGMKLPNMQILDCRHGLDMARIESFLTALKV